MIIGLTGLIGSGKSEVARILAEEADFVRVKFADPLKNMIRTLLADIGHVPSDIERYVEGDLKETVVDGLDHLEVTARHLMVTLGTEWGRFAIHPDIWISLWKAKAERFEHVIADDVRFDNEVATIRAVGGKVWQVIRPGVIAGEHVSEHLITEVDHVIENDGTLEDLMAKVKALL